MVWFPAGYQFYVGDVGNALFSYAYDLGWHGQLLAGIQHTGYGSLQGYDETGAGGSVGAG